MASARRVYVYLLSGISLAVLLVGLATLLNVLFSSLGLGSRDVFDPVSLDRERLTLGAALVTVGLPVWLIHWSLAQRSVRPDREERDRELSSSMRGLYFALVLAILLGVAGANLAALLEQLVWNLGGADNFGLGDAASELSAFVVAGGAWAYHLAVRTGDWRRGRVADGGAWLPRLYLYGAIGVSLAVLLASLIGLADVAIREAVNPNRSSFGGAAWWVGPLARSLSGGIVAGAIWSGHWWYAGRLVTDAGARAAVERPARLRLAYFAAVLVLLAGGVLANAVDGLHVVLQLILGLDPTANGRTLGGLIGTPFAAAGILGAAWWLHRSWLAGDTASIDDPDRPAQVERLDAYGHGLLGLAAAAYAAAWLIALAVEAVFGTSAPNDAFSPVPEQLAVAVPLLILGLLVGGWGWGRAQRSWQREPSAEAGSSIRRAALLTGLGASVVAAIGGTGVLLYRLFGALFGTTLWSSGLGDVAWPIGVVVVALAVGTTSGLAIRRDHGLRAAESAAGPAPGTAAGSWPAGEPAPAPPAEVVEIRLSGPSGAPILAALEALRRELPPDVRVELLGPEPLRDVRGELLPEAPET